MTCRRQEHEKQVQQLQQQLQAAEEEHRSMQERLQASIHAAAAKEAAAAAAAQAEQAAVQAAAQAKRQQQSSAAAAAVAGAQPRLSCPGFQPLALSQQQPVQLLEQQVWQEFEGQRLLNTAAAQPSAAVQRFGCLDPTSGSTASHTCVSPFHADSSSYALRIQAMQNHINALTRSLADSKHGSSSPRRHVHRSGKRVHTDKRSMQEQAKRLTADPPQHGHGQGVRAGRADLFDSDAESDDRSATSSDHSEASSDRYINQAQLSCGTRAYLQLFAALWSTL